MTAGLLLRWLSNTTASCCSRLGPRLQLLSPSSTVVVPIPAGVVDEVLLMSDLRMKGCEFWCGGVWWQPTIVVRRGCG
ncbi:hypothetical protein Hanom_Chr17g01565571 [Helianthus anomalus]